MKASAGDRIVIEPMIEVFGDVACPFTHVSLLRLVERRDRADVRERVHVKAWPLELVNGAPVASDLAAEEIVALRKEVAPDLFAGFDPGSWPVTSLPALALAVAAYRVGPAVGENVSLALRHALFEEGRDIGAREVLDDIADRHGAAADVTDQQAVIEEWHEGQRRGVEGSPCFFARNERFFCPSLDIKHVDGRIVVSANVPERERFLDAILGSCGAS